MGIFTTEAISPALSSNHEDTSRARIMHEQKLNLDVLHELLSTGPIPGMPDLFIDNLLSDPEPDPIDNSCALNYFMIPGSYTLTDIPPVQMPLDIPCNITYNEQGMATLDLGQIPLDQFAPDGKNVLLISPIPALTVKGGSIPILVQTYLADPNRNGANALCPGTNDWISNWMLGNNAVGSGLTENSSQTTACYNASEAKVEVYMYDEAGLPHPVTLTINPNGNSFIFSDTTLTQDGLLKIKLGSKESFAALIESAFVKATLSKIGTDTVIMYAPNGFTLENIDQLPIYQEPVPPTPESNVTPETPNPPADNSTTMSELPSLMQELNPIEPIRPVIGTYLESDLTCLKGCNLNVTLVDEKSILGQDLRNLLLTNSHSQLIPQITNMLKEHTTSWWKFKTWFHNLLAPVRGEEKIFPEANKLDTTQGIVLTNLRILQQQKVGSEMITYALHTDNMGVSRTVVINSSIKDWIKYSTTRFLNDAGAIDAIGTTIHNQIEDNLQKPESSLDLDENEQDLYYFPAEDITTLLSEPRVESLSQDNLSANPFTSGWIIRDGAISQTNQIPSSIHGRDLGFTTWEGGKLVRWIEVWYQDLPKDSPLYNPSIQTYQIGIDANQLTTTFPGK